MINAQKYELVPIEKLRPHPKNPRIGDLEAIGESIRENGFYGVVVAQRSTGYILAGNHRLKSLVAAGEKKVPTVWLDVDDDRAVRILLADNRTNDLAGYDEEALANLLKELDGDYAGTAYDPKAVEDLIASVLGPDGGAAADGPAPELERMEELVQKWAPERGQVWKVGNHRLMCGDSTAGDDVRQLLAGVNPHLMVTDPPYGVEYDPTWRTAAGVNKRKRGAVKNDERVDWTPAWELFPGSVAYVWHAGKHAAEVQASLEKAKFEIRSQIIWGKNRFAFSRGHYHWQHEPCWYAVRGEASWVGDRSQSTLWLIDVENLESNHGTQKPLECMRRPMMNNSSPGQAVYDPFLGSGTSMIAAEDLGRVCYGMEIDQRYCAVILERMAGKGLAPEIAA